MEEGWIKLHRRFLDWEWFDCDGMVRLFIAMLLMANHDEQKWHGETILRGEFITSRDRLSGITGLSAQQVRTCLARLEQTGEITKKSTNKKTIITICKYDKYQVCDEQQQPDNNQQSTSNQPANNQQSTTNKNEENERINNINKQSAPAYTREGDWRFISSVECFSLGNDKDKIADRKKELFINEVSRYSQELGMTSTQQEAFVRWWTEHSPGSDRIKAEYEATFDTRARMQNWMDRDSRRTARVPKSRTESLQENLKFIHEFFNGQQQPDTTADEQ